MDRIGAEIHVEGRVQGVSFRVFVASAARSLGLSGLCRNLESGEVLVRAEGERKKIESLIERLWIGPPAAKVDEVRVVWKPWQGEYEGFIIDG
jgi:acylphosphatase